MFRRLSKSKGVASLSILALTFNISISGIKASTLHYSYDSAGRLVLVDYGNGTAVRYAYDASGNILSQSVLAARLALAAVSPAVSVGETAALNLTITFAQGTDTAIALHSSNPAVASVPALATLTRGSTLMTVSVRALSTGAVTITATLPGGLGGASASADLVVARPAASQTLYSIADRGGLSLVTLGLSQTPTIGYARIQPNAGNTTPAGLAIFGLRQNGILVSEAGVPASPLIRSGRINVEINGPINTGLALVNPNAQPAQVSYFFTDLTGTNMQNGVTTLAANSQFAVFLTDAPFGGKRPFVGTFTFQSSVPIGAIALRGRGTERAEFLLTTLPVADLSLAVTSQTVVFPHFVEGGGWTTEAVLVSTAEEQLSGTLQFFSQGTSTAAAEPMTVIIKGVTASTFPYVIPPRSALQLRTEGSQGAPRVGSIRITPQGGSKAPVGLAIFTLKTGGVTVTEAGVPASAAGRAFRMYAEVTSGAQAIQTGVAVANVSPTPVVVNFELTTLAGAPTGVSGNRTVPANGQLAFFVNELSGFQSLPLPFQGLLRVNTSAAAGVSVIGLRTRTNERGDLLITTTPPVSEETPASNAELVFPHFADGGGYTTQFILFSRAPGQRAEGVLKFFAQSGQPLSLRLK